MDLHYKSFGEGFPIIILHGLFGTLDNWQTIAKQLAEDYQVFIVDQRNHGRSPHHPEFDFLVMADDLQRFMEDNWIYNAHIIGHSMGGKTAMQFTMNYPDMVEKLVVVDISPKAYQSGHDLIFNALFSLDLSKISSRKGADEQLKLQIEDTGVRQFLLKNLTRNGSGGYEWKMNLRAIYKNYINVLRAIESGSPFEKETLFISGGLSDYIRKEDMILINEFFPQAKMVTIPNSGHWVHAESPVEFLEIVKKFLNTN